MNHVGVGHAFKQFHIQMVAGACARAGVGKFAILLPNVFHQLSQVGGRYFGVRDQNQWHARQHGHWLQVFKGVVGQAFVEVRVSGDAVHRHEQGVAVRGRFGQCSFGQGATGTTPVFNNDGLPQVLRQLGLNGSGHGVHQTAGCKRHQHAYGFFWPLGVGIHVQHQGAQGQSQPFQACCPHRGCLQIRKI